MKCNIDLMAGRQLTGPNSDKSSNDFDRFSPLKPLVRFYKTLHNDHLLVGIRIYSWKGCEPQGGWEARSNSAKSSNDFSSETIGQILMKLGHNDHLYSGGDQYLYLKGVWGVGQNSAKSSNDFSETTGQILAKLGHNDHLVVWIRMYTWKWSDSPRGLRVVQIHVVLNLQTTCLKPLVRFW